MRITRLYLRGYRVFEDEHDLHLPGGLIGIYGANGAGKSALVESIRFTLYGHARTSKDEIRSAGYNGECITEVEFEHEGHHYVVRRSISGVNSTVKAQAFAGGLQVTEGVRDVASFVHATLGMDDASFRSSVFAEQKQIAAFTAQRPQQRRELVMRLLGITPLEKARDAARADAKSARDDHERLAGKLPDLTALAERVDAAALVAGAALAEVPPADERLAAAEAEVVAAETEHDRLADVAQTYADLVGKGIAAKETIADAEARIARLEADQAGLADARAELERLQPVAATVDELDELVRRLQALADAEAELAALPEVEAAPEPDPSEAEAARDRLNELRGALAPAEAAVERARAAVERSSDLSPDEDCPVCGQALGGALDAVREHRAVELAEAEAALAALRAQLADAEPAAAQAATRLQQAIKTWQQYEQVAARRAQAEARVSELRSFFVTSTAPETVDLTKNELAAAKQAVKRVAALEQELRRAATIDDDVAKERARRDTAMSTREALLEKVKSLGYEKGAVEAARAARDETRKRRDQARAAAEAVRLQAAKAEHERDKATTELDNARTLHAELGDLADTARHLGRLGDLLHDFRNNVVATVGPRLAAQSAELFAELTDHEYDRLEVDPETWDIQIRDAGKAYGMDRFSGSEVDLANLALRVAISEHVRFQSGGAVGLLVLDEVFGPLDDERKDRMLQALERLKGRFRQVLVVTHDSAIKEQLPSAIHVTKLPGRRARAEVLAGA